MPFLQLRTDPKKCVIPGSLKYFYLKLKFEKYIFDQKSIIKLKQVVDKNQSDKKMEILVKQLKFWSKMEILTKLLSNI